MFKKFKKFKSLDSIDSGSLSESVISRILENGLSLAPSLGVVLSSDDFSDIGLNNSPPSMIHSMDCGGCDGRAVCLTFFDRWEVQNVISLLKTGDRVAFRLCALILLPTRSGLSHGFFAGESVLFCVFCDELIPGFGHSFFLFYW